MRVHADALEERIRKGGWPVPDEAKRPRVGDEGTPAAAGLRAPDMPPPTPEPSVGSDDGPLAYEVIRSSAAVGTAEPRGVLRASSRKELRESEAPHLHEEIARAKLAEW